MKYHKMFESNTDFEFDDEIFTNPFEPQPPKLETKRMLEKENVVESKRLCTEINKTAILLKNIDRGFGDTETKKVLEQEASSSVNMCQFKPKPQLQTKFQDSFRSPMKKVVLRKFPGPAGLLPVRRDFNIDIKASEEANNKGTKQDSAVDMDTICSQMSVSAFQQGPWEKMSKDFESRGIFLPDKYNIAWIKSKAKANKLINRKAPFLAAIIQNIECLNLKTTIVTVVLKDATGQIHGTIVNDLFDEYIELLTVGAVIILKQFSVLTTDHASNHYLTITANNLVAVYSQDASNTDKLQEDSDIKRHVNVYPIQRFSVGDFLKNIEYVKSKYRAALLEEKFNNPELDLENILLNLRTSPQVNSNACRRNKELDVAKRTTPQSGNKLMPPSPVNRSLSTRTFSNPNVNCNVNSINLNNVICNNSVNVDNRTNLGLNKDVNLKNDDRNMPRFNFKEHVNKNKQNECLNSSRSAGGSQFLNDTSNKKINLTCSQISITSDNSEHSAILQTVFEGIDADALFDDF